MSITTIRTLILKTGLHLVLTLLAILALDSVSQAQAPATPPIQQKVDLLLKLLDDPEVKAMLAAKTSAPAVGMPMGASTTSAFMNWSSAIRAHLREIKDAIPMVPGEVSQARSTIMTEIDGRGPGAILLLFIAFAALGFGTEFAFRRLVDRNVRGHQLRAATLGPASLPRHHLIGRYIFNAIAPLVVFAAASIGAFLVFSWPPLLAALLVPMLIALIAWRVTVQIAGILLGTDEGRWRGDEGGETRFIPMDRSMALFWYSRVAMLAGISLAGWAASGMMTTLGFAPPVSSFIVYVFGLGFLAVALEMVWNRAGVPRAHGIKQLLLTFCLCLLGLLWVAGMSLALWIGIYSLLLPPIFRTIGTITKSIFSEPGDAPKSRNVVVEVLIERGTRLIVIALASAWLATILRFRMSGLMEDEDASRILRGLLGGVVILLAADLIWQVAKGLINRRVERARAEGGDEAATARSGRIMTLLPILRNFLAVLIAALAVMMALSCLGVAIGPLIAGAGIFGVAIGFGSQSLVKDVISGVFYMTDDAFRVGEYIQSGTYKGTVESFSIRSVKLRHHRGPIFTVPFGSLGAVQNMSRDWVIDKFLISVNYDTDLALVKKLVKGVGATLLADEEFGPQIIETVKMKGVEAFSDYGINLSFAMMTKPGHQSTIRRRAYAMIREAFAANGIGFASPTVQVGNNDDHSAGAAAAMRDMIVRKKAAEAANTGGEK